MIDVTCPHCSRHFQTETVPGPEVMVRCPKCRRFFTMEGSRVTSESRPPSSFSSKAPEEVWELDADGEEENYGDASVEVFDDIIEYMDDPFMGINEDEIESLPGLPNLPAAIINLIENSVLPPWESMLGLDDDKTPALPELDLELHEAIPVSAPAPKESKSQKRRRHSSRSSLDSVPEVDSTPEPPKEKPLEDILASFVDESEYKEEKTTRYRVRHGDKIFGPFSEQEILDLITKRKLQADDLACLVDTQEWRALKDWPDFKASIEVIGSVKVRKGWEGKRRRRARQAGEAGSQQAGGTSSKGKLIGIAAGILLLLGGGAFGVMQYLKPKPKKQPKVVASKVTRSLQALVQDNIGFYRKTSDNLSNHYPLTKIKGKDAKEKRNKAAVLQLVRYIYYMLDTHGPDNRSQLLADDIQKLLKQKPITQTGVSPTLVQRVQLAKAILPAYRSKLLPLYRGLKKPLDKNDLEWGYLDARVQEAMGKLALAQKAYQGLIKKQGKHVLAHRGLFRVLEKQGKKKEAGAQLQKTLKQAPNHVPTLLDTLDWAERFDLWSAQLPKLKKRIATQLKKHQYPSSLVARWYKYSAQQAWQKKNFAEALLQLDRAATLAPKNVPLQRLRIQYYYRDGQYQLTHQMLESEYSKTSASKEKLLLMHFKVLSRLGKKPILKGFLEALPKRVKSPKKLKLLQLYFQARQALQQGDIQKALQALKKAQTPEYELKLSAQTPLFGLISSSLAEIYVTQQQITKAKNVLKPLYEQVEKQSSALRSENHIKILQVWFTLLLAQEQYEKAQKLKSITLKRFPKHSTTYLLQAKFELSKQHYKEAQEALQKALQFQGLRSSPLLLDIAQLHHKQKNYTKALAFYERYSKSVKKKPDCTLRVLKAKTLYALKRCSEVLKSVLLPCQSVETYIQLARCTQQLKNKKRAQKSLKKALELAPKSPLVHLAVAESHMLAKRTGKALKSYKKALTLNPHSKKALQAIIAIHLQRAKRSRNKKHVAAALAQLEAQRKHVSNQTPILLQQTTIMLEHKQWKKAQKQLKAALESTEITPISRSYILAQMGRLYASRKQYKKALGFFQQARQKYPRVSLLYLEEADIFAKQKRNFLCSKALQAFENSGDYTPTSGKKLKKLKKLCQ